MSHIDDAVLATLRSGPADQPLNVYDGYAPANEADKVVSIDLPYVVVHRTPDFPSDATYDQGTIASTTHWSIVGVGATPEQVKAALARADDRLGEFITEGPNEPRFSVTREPEPPPIRREDTYTRPGGQPLFYGSVRYSACA